MDSFHLSSIGNRLQTGYPYNELPFNQRNDPHSFYPSFDNTASVERNIRLVLDPEVSYSEKTSIVWHMVFNLLSDSYQVEGVSVSLSRLFLGILALDGMVPGCEKEMNSSSLLELCNACAEGLVVAFEVPETIGVIFGNDLEGPDEEDLEGREGEIDVHIAKRCAEARERLEKETSKSPYPCSLESLTLTSRQSICVILRHALEKEGSQFKDGGEKGGNKGCSLLKTQLDMGTNLSRLRHAGITALQEMALVAETVDIERINKGEIAINILHMMCEEGVHIALSQSILNEILIEVKQKKSNNNNNNSNTEVLEKKPEITGQKSSTKIIIIDSEENNNEVNDTDQKVNPENDELILQLRTLELCIEQLQIETMAIDPPPFALSLHPLGRMEMIRALVLACSPSFKSVQSSEISQSSSLSYFTGLPSFINPHRSICALVCARLLLLSGTIGNGGYKDEEERDKGDEREIKDTTSLNDFIITLSNIPFGRIIDSAVPLIIDLATANGQNTTLSKDIRTLMCGIVGSLWGAIGVEVGKQDPLTKFIPSLCKVLTSRNTDDPTYVLDVSGLLQKSSRNPTNLTQICEYLKGFPIMLQACVDTPYALQNIAYIETMAGTLGDEKKRK